MPCLQFFAWVVQDLMRICLFGRAGFRSGVACSRERCAEASAPPRASVHPPSPPYVCICSHICMFGRAGFRSGAACSRGGCAKASAPPELRRNPPEPSFCVHLHTHTHLYVRACRFSVRSRMLQGGGAPKFRPPPWRGWVVRRQGRLNLSGGA